MSTVREVVDAVADGSMTVEEAILDFMARTWPPKAPTELVDGYPDTDADSEPGDDDDFAVVEQAFVDRRIDQDTYGKLAEAAAAAMNGSTSRP